MVPKSTARCRSYCRTEVTCVEHRSPHPLMGRIKALDELKLFKKHLSYLFYLLDQMSHVLQWSLFTQWQAPPNSVRTCSHCSPCSSFARFAVRTVRTHRTVCTVHCSNSSHNLSCSHCSLFALFARFSLFALFAVRTVRKI